jgi:hypothetical protein
MSRAGLSSSTETLGNYVNFQEVYLWCLTCSTIWLPGPFTVPFLAILRLSFVLVDSIAFFLGMMVSFGIMQISLIHEESNKLTVLLAMIAISSPPLFSYLS